MDFDEWLQAVECGEVFDDPEVTYAFAEEEPLLRAAWEEGAAQQREADAGHETAEGLEGIAAAARVAERAKDRERQLAMMRDHPALAIEVRQGRARLNSALLVVDRPDCQVISLDFATKVRALGFGGRGGSLDTEVFFEPAGEVEDWSAEAVTTVTVKGGAPHPEQGVWLVEASCSRYSAWIYRWIEPSEAPVLFEAEPAPAEENEQ